MFDAALECIRHFTEKFEHQTQMTEVRLIRFEGNALVIMKNDEDETIRFFRDNQEIIGQWIENAYERQRIVAAMIRQGMKQVIIAKMLKVSAGLISQDVKYLKNYTNELKYVKKPLRKTKNPVMPSFASRWDDAQR